MFTGIIETLGKIENIEKEGSNVHFTLSCSFLDELSIDQSIAHNGVCLTVVDITSTTYTVTAIQETLEKTSMRRWEINDLVNLERCMPANGRFDGHIVQGHVDSVGVCKKVEQRDGSWVFHFIYESDDVTVEKGSVTVNGTSLTVVDSTENEFSVHIIPYTYEHTVFKNLKENDLVNLEFDIVGKYVARLLKKA